MQDPIVTFRLNPRLKAAVLRQARRDELSFSDVVRILLKAYATGEVTVGVTKVSKKALAPA